ncbi:MAG: tetratricopeptide (TPR) repeat protein [Gammaproteobacteria bacterium]
MTGCARAAAHCIALLLLLAGAVSADAPSVPLFEQLRNAPDFEQARRVESKIWQRWMQHPDERVSAQFLHGVQLMDAGEYLAAVDQFSAVLQRAPDFPEAWNKRATAYFLLDEMAASVADIERTLSLEPRHFGALSGLGLIFLSRGDRQGALSAFEKVLQIHPFSESARVQVDRLRRSLHRNSI